MTISSALYQAILSARQSNPTAYSNVASNYLLGSGATTSQLQQIANTGTFAIVTGNNKGVGQNYAITTSPAGSSTPLIETPITNTLSGIISSFAKSVTSPSLPSTTGNNVPGSTAGPNTQTVFTPAGNTSDSLTTTFNQGITQVGAFFKNHPEVLVGAVAFGVVFLFGAIKK